MDIKNGYEKMDIKRWIFKILDIRKVLALIIAEILWYYVYNLEQSIEEYIIPIDFSEKPLEIKRMEIKRMDIQDIGHKKSFSINHCGDFMVLCL